VNDPLTVAELDAPARPAVARALPYLWTIVAVLLMSSITAAVLHEDPATPAERVAAAQAAATQQDYAFEAGFDGPAPLGDLRFRGGVDVETSRLRGSMTLQGQKIEIVQDGLVQYLHLPAGTLGTTGKPWLRTDLSKLGLTATSAPGAGLTNPIEALRSLDAIVGDVEEVGHEKVRGDDTTHFRFVVDAAKAQPKAAELLPEEQLERLRKVPVDLWLDGDDRPRRVRQTLDMGATTGGSITTTVETFDFGKDVTVEVPPADQVQDFDLQNPLGAGGAPAPSD
jgi:hypothetical protein